MFESWQKIPRYSGPTQNVVISEKMDGTNACIIIEDGVIVGTQSRKRMITPQDDNYGFAGWVERNNDELLKLGDGRHFGEWVGLGIQKNPHNFDCKKFYLFNSGRWWTDRPSCCEVVMVLYSGELQDMTVDAVMTELKGHADQHDYEAEGVIIYYTSKRTYEKATFKNQGGKWQQQEATT